MTNINNRIGFIGLGLMGQGFTKCLKNADYFVVGYDIIPDKIKQAVSHGVIPSKSPKEVAELSDIIMMCVTTTNAVENVVFGPDGIIEGGNKKQILIDHSTTVVEDTKNMAIRLKKEVGMGWVDAPVSGGPVGAEEGSLAIMAGGDDEDIKKVRHVMEVVSSKFSSFGPVGSGQIVKMVNQILVLNNFAIIAEALALAEAGGIDASKIPAALASGHAGSNLLNDLMPRMIARDFSPHGFCKQILKDFDILHDLAMCLQTPTPMSNQASSLFRILNSKGNAELDGAAILKLYDRNCKI